eukprot:comp23024_c1_seq2/m.36777 comp23024_c1_seq2/g.36777  ORF comp23024_c1_seq2/g.36777 comp23024_c1_seq2/m.36777 type:complete len:252 (-) comp23024_c1_seq2:481-1236(-)
MSCVQRGRNTTSHCSLFFRALELKTSYFTHEGCYTVCPSIYEPVCGTDGVTYPNDCSMKAAACKANKQILVARPGTCEAQGYVVAESETGKCASVCDLETSQYQPMCYLVEEREKAAPRTFQSRCQMEIASCEEHVSFVQTDMKMCLPDMEEQPTANENQHEVVQGTQVGAKKERPKFMVFWGIGVGCVALVGIFVAVLGILTKGNAPLRTREESLLQYVGVGSGGNDTDDEDDEGDWRVRLQDELSDDEF